VRITVVTVRVRLAECREYNTYVETSYTTNHVTDDRERERLSLQDYRTIFDNLSEGILVHPPDSDEIVGANDRRCDMLGYTREELLDRSVADITPDDWDPPISATERIEQARREGQTTFEWRDQCKDGSTFWVEVNLTLVTLGDDYVLASVRNISERKRRERRLRAVFDNTYQFTGLMDPDGTVLEANETALTFGDLDRDDVIQKRLWECYWFQHSEATRKRVEASVRRAAEGEFVRHNLEINGTDGTEIVDFSIRPITDERGDVTLLIPEARVITELLEHQRRVEVYNRVMRHNLRNKLTIIEGMAGEIERSTDDDRIATLADTVRSASNRIDDIVEQIREFDHLRQQDCEAERVDVAKLLGDLADDYATDGTTVRTDADPGTTIYTNRALLKLVLSQLLENAVEHGGPTVRLTAARTAHDDGVEIAVHDDGPGIPPDEFDSLYGETASQVEHTTGIGLLISQWGTTELGGDIEFESDEGEGTTVTIRIPDELWSTE
jgi:PAS domain S-box-containing protein